MILPNCVINNMILFEVRMNKVKVTLSRGHLVVFKYNINME